MPLVEAGELMAKRNGSVDPAKFPDEVFELHSIPAFDAGMPDVVAGREIGSAKQIVQPNDVMISKIVPHIRRGSIVGAFSGHRQIASGEWIVFRSDRLYPNYMRQLLVSDWFHAEFMRTVSGVGGSLLRARPAEVAKIILSLPSLSEQRRIAAILDKADTLRAKRREAIDKLDKLLQSVFLDMFGDPVSNPRHWPFQPLSELLERKTSNGAYFPPDRYVDSGGVAMVHMSDAFYGTVRKASLKHVDAAPSDIAKYGLTTDDILVSRRSLNYEGAAKPCLIGDAAQPLIFESSLIRVSPDRVRLKPLYLFHYLSNARARAEYVFRHVTKSTISGINQAGLNRVEIMLPDMPTQEKFVNACNRIAQMKMSVMIQGGSLDRLFLAIQQRAFSGAL